MIDFGLATTSPLSPPFLSLALGIGVNTAIYSFMETLIACANLTFPTLAHAERKPFVALHTQFGEYLPASVASGSPALDWWKG